MNESAKGRDGYILGCGRKFYHVYKQSFPMEYWYGLVPDANRESSDPKQMIDVRTLPEKYRRSPVEFSILDLPRRSWNKAMRDQLHNHCSAFAAAQYDGFDFEAHAAQEYAAMEVRWEAERVAREARLALIEDDDDCPF